MKTVVIFFLHIISFGLQALTPPEDNTFSVRTDADEILFADSLYSAASDPKLSYREKTNLLYRTPFYGNAQRGKTQRFIDALLPESKKRKDANALLYEYSCLANTHLVGGDEELYNAYIDSADMYYNKAKNRLALAGYHYAKGLQSIDKPRDRKKGYMHLEAMVDCFDRPELLTGKLLCSMAEYMTKYPDVRMIATVISKVERLLKDDNSLLKQLIVMSGKSDFTYYYYQVSQSDDLFDLAIAYKKQSIALYDACRNDGLQELPDFDALQACALVAEYYFMKQNPDWDYIEKCLEKAKIEGRQDDDYAQSLINYLEAISFFGKEDYAQAEKHIAAAERHAAALGGESLDMFKINYADLHSRALQALGKFREAIAYNTEKNEMKRKKNEKAIRELEYLYNADDANLQIEQMEKAKDDQLRYTSVFMIASMLLSTTFVILYLWYYMKKKNTQNQIALLNAENEEEELRLKLKEEQLVKMQLEKYDILSENHIKELELADRNSNIQELVEAKAALDSRIQAYIQQINEYETRQNELQNKAQTEEDEKTEEDEEFEYVMHDISRALNKHFPRKKEYIEMLEHIHPNFISELKRIHNGKISSQAIKYCICFSIGMDPMEISECFAIELSSVHMLRYRLKKRFRLDANDNMNVFLRKLNYSVH